jgi:hypothetical protein
MKNRDFVSTAMVIFLIVGLVHLYRAFNNLPITIGQTMIPVTVSWVAGVLALYLAYSAYKLR